MIVVVGLSHKTAPIEVRERLAIGRDQCAEFLRRLKTAPQVLEAMLISTCNRVEVVAAGPRAELTAVATAAVHTLEQYAPGIGGHLYRHVGGDAVRHLFRVASSLDSLVLGEPQILGQVKDAFETSRASGALGPILHRAVPRAVRAAKRVRNETAIGTGKVSVPNVAVDLTRQIFGDLKRRTVLLVGAGEMAETVARLLQAAGAGVLVLGRTKERVEALAAEVGGQPRTWADLRASLVEADVVITSTSAPGFVVEYEMVQAARRSRRGREQSFIDLAVPRDVDPRVNELDGVFLYNIDDFSRLVGETLSERSRSAEMAEHLVEQETLGWERWAEAEQATPTILRLRGRLREALLLELDRSLRGRLKHLGPDDRAALVRMIEAAENRLLHAPTVRLRKAALDREGGLSLDELSLALDELFELDRAPDTQSGSEQEPMVELPRSDPRATGTNGR